MHVVRVLKYLKSMHKEKCGHKVCVHIIYLSVQTKLIYLGILYKNSVKY